MKSFFQFLSEAETEAASQAKKLGLKGDGHGGWVNRAGEFVAKTVDGKLKFFGKNQKPGRDPDQTPNTKKVEPKLKTKTMSVDKAPQKEKKKGGDEAEKVVGSDTITLAFGRFNPPTVGHEKLLKMAKKVAANGTLKIFPSRTQDKKKNPLDADTKISMMRSMFPQHSERIMNDPGNRSIFDVLKRAHNDGYANVRIVAGQDRVKEFDKLSQSYNGALYQFDGLEVISSGDRDPDSDGVEGLSSSRMRLAAMEGDFKTFRSGLPEDIPRKQAMALFDTVRQGMGVDQVDECWNIWEIAPKEDPQNLREAYIAKEVFNIGDLVENLNNGLIGRIIRRGANHLICVTEDKIMFKSWIKDVQEAIVNGTTKSGVSSDNRLVGTDKFRKYVETMVPGSSYGLQFINKYKVRKK